MNHITQLMLTLLWIVKLTLIHTLLLFFNIFQNFHHNFMFIFSRSITAHLNNQ